MFAAHLRFKVEVTVTTPQRSKSKTYTLSLHRRVEWVEVDASWFQACGLRSNGQVACWGRVGGYWKTGLDSHFMPKPVIEWLARGEVYRHLVVGRFESCGIKVNGDFDCWVRSDHPARRATDPIDVDRVEGDVLDLSMFSYFTKCWIPENRRVQCQCMNVMPEEILSRKAVQVETGYSIACILDTDREISCWRHTVGMLRTPPGPWQFMSFGASLACAIRPSGSLHCRGYIAAQGDDMPSWQGYSWHFQDASRSYVWADGMYLLNYCGVTSQGDPICPGRPAGNRTGLNLRTITVAWNGARCGITTDGDVRCWNARWPMPDLDADAGIREAHVGGSKLNVAMDKSDYIGGSYIRPDVYPHYRGTGTDYVVDVPATATETEIKVYPGPHPPRCRTTCPTPMPAPPANRCP